VFIPAKPPTQSLPSPVVSTNPNVSGNNSSTIITIERAYSGNSSNPKLSNQVAALPPVTLDPTTGKPFQYRVIVPTTTASVSQRVKTIVPDAFRVSRSGRSVLQAGAYSDRQAADELVQKLAQSGVNAEIIPFR
jgi:cell division protein FtsN